MKKECVLSVFVLIFFTFLFVSDGYSAETRGVTKDTIKIGIMMSQTGSLADTGIPYTTGAKNYFRYLNDSGGINGRKVNVLVEDDRYAIPAAIAAFKKFVYKDEIMAMMGAGGTAPVTALFKSIEKEKMPTIAISLAESIVNPHKRYMFIAGSTYREQMGIILDYLMNDLPIKKPRIAFVYPDHQAGYQDLKPFEERTEKYGIKLADKEVLNFGAMEATAQVLNIKKAKVDYIVIGGSIVQNANVLLRELRKFGISTPVYGSFGTCTENLVEVAGEAAKNFYGVNTFSSWYEDAPGVKFMRKITEKYKTGEDRLFRSRFNTQGWLCAIIFAEGMKRAGKNLDGEALIDNIETLKDFDSGGLTGLLTYGKNKHYGSEYWKLYKANVEKKIMEPLTDWRKPLELK
ncbi:MAG: ABC transporter substrate-binding protein [Thermodesulfobacteriota bacterium]